MLDDGEKAPVHTSDSLQGTNYIENLKWQIGRDINHVTFGKCVTLLVQKLKILGVYKNCKSRYSLQISFF